MALEKNRELYKFYKERRIKVFSTRLQQVGHALMIENNIIIKKLYKDLNKNQVKCDHVEGLVEGSVGDTVFGNLNV